ncbi:M14 family zinc carboxypeptidase [Thiomicrorhabdus sp. Milos-T2]|uniref:M14 family zinc carboxypeptidase n=1 Tax=Thiomicrorhabdus sp. Milos-T2 TaxID=90814 RepID=UPI000A05E8E3|nr:M14 family zinc carboxypeptidase [Thiomicrorhabdus sp. Milos-T2]
MFIKFLGLITLTIYQAWSINALAANKTHNHSTEIQAEDPAIKEFCKEWSRKLRTVKYQGCMKLGLETSGAKSVKGRVLTQRHFKPAKVIKGSPEGRILFISGIHGDEYSAISMTYLWMQNMIKHQKENRQHWLFYPLVNPDGLFRTPATRINANNTDLNRNFPSPDWGELAIRYWKKYYKKNKRRYPGKAANSEPETQWLVKTIEEFKPDAIISVHAPYGLLDYDGPEHAVPNRIGALKHRELGTYPGSLGRYAGEYLNIPVLTLELRSAGSMPTQKEIYKMWKDLEHWTISKIQAQKTSEAKQALNQKLSDKTVMNKVTNTNKPDKP